MFIIKKTYMAEIAHQLPLHDGKCKFPHGHSIGITTYCSGDSLIKEGPKTGMLLDYGDVSKAIKPIIEQYIDHNRLNDSLEMEHPTSENIAVWLYEKLKPLLPSLKAVEIAETATSSCYYEP